MDKFYITSMNGSMTSDAVALALVDGDLVFPANVASGHQQDPLPFTNGIRMLTNELVTKNNGDVYPDFPRVDLSDKP